VDIEIKKIISEYKALSNANIEADVLLQLQNPLLGEMVTRWDMVASPPDILVTNFSMLNVMLMRDVENNIFESTKKWLAQSKDNIFTFLYYVNDSDGDTIFFNDFLDGNEDHNITELIEVHRETPKCGTGLLFKSNQLHTPTPPKYSNRRIVVNYVFEVYETNNTKF
jgi:hypothetical protein